MGFCDQLASLLSDEEACYEQRGLAINAFSGVSSLFPHAQSFSSDSYFQAVQKHDQPIFGHPIVLDHEVF